MPANVTLAVGQNITIQVIEIAQHGAALYSVRFFLFLLFLFLSVHPPLSPWIIISSSCGNCADIILLFEGK